MTDPVDDALEDFWQVHRKKIIRGIVILVAIIGVINLWQPFIGSAVKVDQTSRGSYLGVCNFLTLKLWRAEIIKTHYAISRSGNIYAMGSTKKSTLKDIDCALTAFKHKK